MADAAEAAEAAGEASVGRLVDCSQAEDRRMIRYVRARPLLYARNNLSVSSYFSQVKTLWQEVADEMGWTVAEVRRKWSHVRNSYSRHLRNEAAGARTGRGRQVSRWYLADELDFLRQHMATDVRWSPYASYAPSLVKMEAGEEELAPASLAFPARAISEDGSFAADENCSYFQFFRGLYPEYEELAPQLQRVFKRRCLVALHDLLDEQDAAAGGREGREGCDGREGGEGEVGSGGEEPEPKVLVIQQHILP